MEYKRLLKILIKDPLNEVLLELMECENPQAEDSAYSIYKMYSKLKKKQTNPILFASEYTEIFQMTINLINLLIKIESKKKVNIKNSNGNISNSTIISEGNVHIGENSIVQQVINNASVKETINISTNKKTINF